MSRVVNSQDFPRGAAIAVMVALNPEHVKCVRPTSEYDVRGTYLVSDVSPEELVYPYGWYYAKNSIRNKHMSTSGRYEEIPLYKPDGEQWDCKICTPEY